MRKDVAAVAAATADDYVQIDADGDVLDKAAALERINSSYARLQSNPMYEMVVRVYGDTSVLTRRGSPRGTIDGRPATALRYTRVYVKQTGVGR